MIRAYYLFAVLILIPGICLAQSSKYFALYSPEGDVLIKPNIYSYWQMTGDGLLLIQQKKGSYGLISRKGEMLIHPVEIDLEGFRALPEFKKWVNHDFSQKTLALSSRNIQ